MKKPHLLNLINIIFYKYYSFDCNYIVIISSHNLEFYLGFFVNFTYKAQLKPAAYSITGFNCALLKVFVIL